MRRPAPQKLEDIQHPGPKADNRLPFALCHASTVSVSLGAGSPLVEALGRWADDAGFTSAVLDLSGFEPSAFDYVMPDRAVDDRHVAWYSDTHSSNGAALDEAVAVLGWRDGNWFAHVHAYWHEGGRSHLGHLLPNTLTTAANATLSGYGIKGARFEAAEDPETEFTLYRVEAGKLPDDRKANALVTTLAPFEDFHSSVAKLSKELDAETIDLMGLGSFAGAGFHEGPAMTGLISEILVRPAVTLQTTSNFQIPVRCVDLNGDLFEGLAKPGKCPTLVTCELLLVGEA